MNQRDRDVAISRGLGRGLVATGAAGSLGFAVVAALSSPGLTGSAPPPPSGTHAAAPGRPAAGASAAAGRGDDDQPVRPRRRQRPSVPLPRLRPGTGAPQAVTAGS